MVSFCPSRGYCSYSVHSWSPPSGAAPAISIDTGFSMAMSKVLFFFVFFSAYVTHIVLNFMDSSQCLSALSQLSYLVNCK